MIVHAVVFGNYYPREVLALYDNLGAAEEHAKVEDQLEVVEMHVCSTYVPGGDQ